MMSRAVGENGCVALRCVGPRGEVWCADGEQARGKRKRAGKKKKSRTSAALSASVPVSGCLFGATHESLETCLSCLCVQTLLVAGNCRVEGWKQLLCIMRCFFVPLLLRGGQCSAGLSLLVAVVFSRAERLSVRADQMAECARLSKYEYGAMLD